MFSCLENQLKQLFIGDSKRFGCVSMMRRDEGGQINLQAHCELFFRLGEGANTMTAPK